MNELVVIPGCYQHRVLKLLHSGHQGIVRTKAVARSVVYWANNDDDILNMCVGVIFVLVLQNPHLIINPNHGHVQMDRGKGFIWTMQGYLTECIT